MSLLYGVRAALTLDEFALWLNLQDVYFSREGRSSFDAIILFGSLLAVGACSGRAPFATAWQRRSGNRSNRRRGSG